MSFTWSEAKLSLCGGKLLIDSLGLILPIRQNIRQDMRTATEPNEESVARAGMAHRPPPPLTN